MNECINCLTEGKTVEGTHCVKIAGVEVHLCDSCYDLFVDTPIVMEDFYNEEYQD